MGRGTDWEVRGNSEYQRERMPGSPENVARDTGGLWLHRAQMSPSSSDGGRGAQCPVSTVALFLRRSRLVRSPSPPVALQLVTGRRRRSAW